MGWKVGDGAPPEEIKQEIWEKTWGGENREKTIAAMRAAGYKHTWYTAKKRCTAKDFAAAYNKLLESGMKWNVALEAIGMPKSTFKLWVKKFEQDGKLNGDRFTDGKPVYLNMVPIFEGSRCKRKKAELRNRKDG